MLVFIFIIKILIVSNIKYKNINLCVSFGILLLLIAHELYNLKSKEKKETFTEIDQDLLNSITKCYIREKEKYENDKDKQLTTIDDLINNIIYSLGDEIEHDYSSIEKDIDLYKIIYDVLTNINIDSIPKIAGKSNEGIKSNCEQIIGEQMPCYFNSEQKCNDDDTCLWDDKSNRCYQKCNSITNKMKCNLAAHYVNDKNGPGYVKYCKYNDITGNCEDI